MLFHDSLGLTGPSLYLLPPSDYVLRAPPSLQPAFLLLLLLLPFLFIFTGVYLFAVGKLNDGFLRDSGSLKYK